ncbi:MAG: ribosomal protein S18-alanine N-acetyltransferase [Candidatus Faecousia sp.]|nr:ribosomal protein S18-alanine N-acetyltransferase [Clostridiales bacterium]MDY5642301.1 ribosomal protein S18-alanine N-acetyltransferase [Candidatus Faecousia sp.]
MMIEPMNASHVPQIAQLEKRCFSDPWSEKSIASELENPLSVWLVAVDGGQLIGYVGSQTVLGETDMMNLAVAPEARRQGTGRALVLALVDALTEKGSHSLMLEVRVSNTPAQKLYESLGFSQVGRRPKYYVNPREDALILRKEWSV